MTDKKSITIKIRVDSQTHAEIQSRADRYTDGNLSAFVRCATLKYEEQPITDHDNPRMFALIKSAIKLIERTGTNTNQVAKHINEQQKIIREIIEQCARLAAGLTARKHARIVFDALAHADLAEHFNIIACTLLDALRFDELIFGLKELDAFFHFSLDLLERDRHFFARDDVMRRRVDGDML